MTMGKSKLMGAGDVGVTRRLDRQAPAALDHGGGWSAAATGAAC